MSDDQIPNWFYKFILGLVGVAGGVGFKAWFDKFVWKNRERRKDGNYLVINEAMIERIVSSFEEHTKTMRDIANTLSRHEDDRVENSKMIQEIHSTLTRNGIH
jgi:hypothetical protein